MAKPWETRKFTPWELCREIREESQERDWSTAGTGGCVAEFWNGARWGLCCSALRLRRYRFLFPHLLFRVAAQNLLFLILNDELGLRFTVSLWAFLYGMYKHASVPNHVGCALLNMEKLLLKPAGVEWMDQQVTCPLLLFGKMPKLYTCGLCWFSLLKNWITARFLHFWWLNQSYVANNYLQIFVCLPLTLLTVASLRGAPRIL